MLILNFLTRFQRMEHSIYPTLIAFLSKRLSICETPTSYILFFVYLWSCLFNQKISFRYLICITNICAYMDNKTLYAHFLSFIFLVREK
jgi:hypothetical protein